MFTDFQNKKPFHFERVNISVLKGLEDVFEPLRILGN